LRRVEAALAERVVEKTPVQLTDGLHGQESTLGEIGHARFKTGVRAKDSARSLARIPRSARSGKKHGQAGQSQDNAADGEENNPNGFCLSRSQTASRTHVQMSHAFKKTKNSDQNKNRHQRVKQREKGHVKILMVKLRGIGAIMQKKAGRRVCEKRSGHQ